jgi:hypothetical protein
MSVKAVLSQINTLLCINRAFRITDVVQQIEKSVYTPEISLLQETKKDTEVSKNDQLVRVKGL